MPKPAASSNLFDAFANGQVKAMFRYSGQYRDSNLHLLQDSSEPDVSDEKIQQYSAIGGFVGYETAPWLHTTVGGTIYAAVPFGSNPDDRRGLGGLYEEDGGQDAYAALGEMFIKFQNKDHLIKVGRQEMPDYRMVSLSNIRFSPITHSGTIYENRMFENLGINLGYIRRMKERNAIEFIDMAKGARLKESANGKQLVRGDYNAGDYDDTGYIGDEKEMMMLGLTYQREKLSFEGWNYYINDFINSVYLVGQYNIDPKASDLHLHAGCAIYASAGCWQPYCRQRGYLALRPWYSWLHRCGLSFFANYNELSYNENSYDGGTLFLRWGTPQMFNSFQVQDSELAGTKSIGVGLQYDFGRNGLIPGVVMRWRYGDYDLPDKLSFVDARQDRSEATFDLRYSFRQKSGFGIFTEMQGLSLQFRLAYNNYRTDYDFEAYRDLHGYDFQTATKDFVDARLYLDYHF